MKIGKTKEEKARAKELKSAIYKFEEYPHLLAIKPKEKYIFHSDYFQIDNCYATILSYFHIEGATDDYMPFWGIGRIPSGLDNSIVTVSFEQVRRMTKGWIEQHESVAESVNNINTQEAQTTKSTKQMKQKNSKKAQDLEVIARELGDNAAYLQCQFKIMVKAPTLEQLDEALASIARRYNDIFSSLSAAPFMGRQRQELSTLFQVNDKKYGTPHYFTSTEFAGDYSLVTHGLEDPCGEYVGKMFGDVNNSAVLFAVDDYKHHVVIANDNYNLNFGRMPIADFWGSKISQSCLIHNGRVVHVVLDGQNIDMLGPDLSDITYRIDMNRGEVNMFEMFGEVKDELSIFANQMQKLILMAEQAYQTTDSDRSIIRNSLEKVATEFYIEQRMWRENAKEHLEDLRVVGLPHDDIPRLQLFVSYLDQAHRAALAATPPDPNLCNALSVLNGTFRNLLSANGDLFNNPTSKTLDGVKSGRRVIYDFATMRNRGEGVAMAQLVNIIGYAVGNLGAGDSLIIHGAEKIVNRVKEYITAQFDMLYAKGGRVVFLYNDIDSMLHDMAFSHFDKADYTIFGTMTENQVDEYQQRLHKTIPGDLARLVTTKDNNLAYLKRDYNNIIFIQDLLLGIQRTKGGTRV